MIAGSGPRSPGGQAGGFHPDDEVVLDDDPTRDFEWLCRRPLHHRPFPRVGIEAEYVKRRVDGVAVFDALVAVTGITDDGEVEILGFDAGDSEDLSFWMRLLFVLRLRGLHGVKRVLAFSEHEGLAEAVEANFPDAELARAREFPGD